MYNNPTAVEWLINKVEDHFCLLPVDLIEQAKAMEKEQIKDAYDEGDIQLVNAEQYYNQTYNQNK